LPAIRKTGSYQPQAHQPKIEKMTTAQIAARHNALVPHAYKIASDAATQIGQAIFEAILQEDDLHTPNRFMVSLKYGRDGKSEGAQVSQIPDEAFIASLAQLAQMIADPWGMHPKMKDLAKLAAACNQRMERSLD